MYSKSITDAIEAKLDIVDIIQDYIKLEKAGGNYKACCPFHEEKSASFSVSSKGQFYNCFGCGAGGNMFDFVKNHENIPFPAVVEKLAEKAGIELPKEKQQSQKEKQQYSAAYNTLGRAAEIYQKNLINNANPAAVHALQARGINQEMVQAFGLGVALDKWDDVTGQLGRWKARQALDESGIAVYKAKDEKAGTKGKLYDRFRNGIIFPIQNGKGNVVSFARRRLSNDSREAKYINGVDSLVFDKSQVLYGMYQSLQANSSELSRFIVTEGYIDVVMSHQHGFTETVAAMGTTVSQTQIRSMLRHTPNLFFVFDGDGAGVKASVKSLNAVLPALDENVSVNFVFLPDGDDPDSFIRKYGGEVYDAYIAKNTVTASQFILKLASHGVDMDSTEGRSLFFSRASTHLDQMPPSAFKAALAARVSEISGIKIKEVLPISINLMPKVDPVAVAEKVTKMIEAELNLQSGEVRIEFTPPKIQAAKTPVIAEFKDIDVGKEYAERATSVQRALKLEQEVLGGFTLSNLYRKACQEQGDSKELARATIDNYLTGSNAFESSCRQVVINMRAIRDCMNELIDRDQLTAEKATQISGWTASVQNGFGIYQGIANISSDDHIKHVADAATNSVNTICADFQNDLAAILKEQGAQASVGRAPTASVVR